MRMMFDVQKGIVHNRNSTICHLSERTWNARKYATVKPIVSVNIHVRSVNLNVDR